MCCSVVHVLLTTQEVPAALEQALTAAKGAAEEHAVADKVMKIRERRRRAKKRRIERDKRQKEQQELENGSLEEDAIGRHGHTLCLRLLVCG